MAQKLCKLKICSPKTYLLAEPYFVGWLEMKCLILLTTTRKNVFISKSKIKTTMYNYYLLVHIFTLGGEQFKNSGPI